MNDSLFKITWSENGSRMRKVVKRSNYRVTGKYPSWKMQRMMQWESTIERDAFYLFDGTPGIISFHEQPAEIIYTINGKRAVHFPDVLIITSDHRQLLLEIKSDKESQDDEIMQRTNLLKRLLAEQELSYVMLTESQIKLEPRLANMKTILRFGRKSTPLFKQERVIRTCFKNKICHLGTVLSQQSGKEDFSVLCRMILDGTVSLPLNDELNEESLLTLNAVQEAVQWL